MLKARNRIINFRVTEDELVQLREASVENGARCLSDFARATMLLCLGGSKNQPASEGRHNAQLRLVAQRLGTVERNIAKLEKLMSWISPDEQKETNPDGAQDQASSETRSNAQLRSAVQRLGTVERNIAKLEKLMSRISPDEREEMRVAATV